MNDAYFEKLADDWMPAFRDAARTDGLHRMLIMFAKEVSRDTRHRAYDVAQAAARDIMNLRDSQAG